MASVTSLDADMRNLRLSRYTPQAANQARDWIEEVLGAPLAKGDLLEVLKDGVTLCKLANLAVQNQRAAIKFKPSPMPFIQMENISHFLKACELPPLGLPAHDRFLTVDLFEQKDPAQVLQCLSAFSRQANKINPSSFPNTIGPKKATTAMSPTHTGGVAEPVSSWSSKKDERATAPAWNIHQYGYMGGASQGNQGINFGARRQITNQAPAVPSLAEKERIRKEKEAEADRLHREEVDRHEAQLAIAREQEQRERAAEEQRWEAEAKRLRDEERKRVEDQKREWELQEQTWKEQEDARQREAATFQSNGSANTSVLRGQSLAEYQREQTAAAKRYSGHRVPADTPEKKRVRELEMQLEEARERERQYQAERQQRLDDNTDAGRSRAGFGQTEAQSRSTRDRDVSWEGDEREILRQQWQQNQEQSSGQHTSAVSAQRPPSRFSAYAPEEQSEPEPSAAQPPPVATTQQPRQLPQLPTEPQAATPSPKPFFSRSPVKAAEQQPLSRVNQFLETNTAPSTTSPRISGSREAGDTSHEQSALRDARIASQQTTKAGAWASKSLLEREMERERERQREWEANQETLKSAPRDQSQGVGEGQTWDVNQYGYMGGDNMNKGSSVGSGINIGGRRQIVGPRGQP